MLSGTGSDGKAGGGITFAESEIRAQRFFKERLLVRGETAATPQLVESYVDKVATWGPELAKQAKTNRIISVH